MPMANYPHQRNPLHDFFLEGDIRQAQLVLYILGGLPFVFICALTVFKVAVSAKLILVMMANLSFFGGLAALLNLVRHKESRRPGLTIVLASLFLLLTWAAAFFAIYLIFTL